MNNKKIAVIGLGYVGLPLCVEFAKHFPTVGFDISARRVHELRQSMDRTREVEQGSLQVLNETGQLAWTTQLADLADSNVYVVTVPTPIDKNHRPDLEPLLRASETVGRVLKPRDIVIFESTVYPGATEEDCVPVLERMSGLTFNVDFFCGYSPERINPGDKLHRVTNIKKVTSGSTPATAREVDALYRTIIPAGTHLAPSIKVAEAAKVIENAQRDVNIAFVNELAMIFNKLGIDTRDVLAAAGTKWNFLPFTPGLVGGHCIGVDPYYLAQKAQEIGYNPEMLLAGRRINDNMGLYVANQVVKLMIRKGQRVEGARVLVLGITFKENCPDIRNTRVIDVVRELQDFGCLVDVYDPWADSDEVLEEYGITLLGTHLNHKGEEAVICRAEAGLGAPLGECPGCRDVQKELNIYSAVVLAVAHDEFEALALAPTKDQVVYDIKAVLPEADGAL